MLILHVTIPHPAALVVDLAAPAVDPTTLAVCRSSCTDLWGLLPLEGGRHRGRQG
uniref:Uncharacterized protein n=1 Tax=Arundo donax TaxID=35708 RepID=A0A0A9AMF9_ARUDO